MQKNYAPSESFAGCSNKRKLSISPAGSRFARGLNFFRTMQPLLQPNRASPAPTYNHQSTALDSSDGRFQQSELWQTKSRKSRFHKSGKPRIAHRKTTLKTTTRRKISEWSVLEKPAAPLRSPPPCRIFVSFSGAGEGIRTPDPLITNQMLYRLSYASNWGKARFRTNLSHGSLPDVRDN